MQMLKSSACLQCNIAEGEQAHRTFHNTWLWSAPQGAQVCNHDSFKQQLHQSAHTAEFKCNLSSFPLCTAFPSYERSEPSKESIVEERVISITSLLPYLLHRPWHSFFGKPGLWLPFNGENFSNPLYSTNLIKGFTEPIQDCCVTKIENFSSGN